LKIIENVLTFLKHLILNGFKILINIRFFQVKNPPKNKNKRQDK